MLASRAGNGDNRRGKANFMVTRIECPSCQQPIDVTSSSSSPAVKAILGAAIAIACLAVAGCCILSMRYSAARVKAAVLEQEVASLRKSSADLQWEMERARLVNYDQAVKAARAAVLDEFENIQIDRDTWVLEEINAELKNVMHGLPAKTDVQIQAVCWDRLCSEFKEWLKSSIDQPVAIDARITDPWGKDSWAKSNFGLTNSVWPEHSDGQLKQYGAFFVRDCSLPQSTQIKGMGRDALPILWTNRLGEVRMLWSYRLEADAASR